jgi:signal transduction histidine kinase
MALSLARFVESGKIELARSEVELGDVVLEAVNCVLPLVILRRQLLVTDITDEGLVVHADVRRLTQALERLLTNVAKLSAREATIVVTTRRHAGRAVTTVTSSTLPDASLEQLGLAYVAQLCELHDGALVATPGQLRVMLPHRE